MADLACGTNCAGITWDFEVQQLTFGGGFWGGFFALGLALSITAATSNVDSWRMHLELTCLRISTSKFILVADFVLASIQCIHFCVRTYTSSLTMVGFVLEAISGVFCFCLMLPFWAFAHCEGILSGFAWMFMDRAIPDALMIGAIVSLPVTEVEGKKTWFAPSWLAAFHLLRTWTKLLRAYKINMEIFRNQIIDAVVSTLFKVYLLAMMMLTFENLGEPEFMQSFSQEKWNTISSLYFILTSVATVGFGDLAPVTSVGRLSTVFAIYFGLAWLATVAYRSLQILAVNQTGGGFFEPILHSKYIVVIGNPTGLMLRNFLAEIFHPDHAEDADDLHVSVILSPGHPGMELVMEWLRQPENIQMLPRIHIFQGTALNETDLNRVTISAATCVFILPNLLCRSVMQEDTENIIRMMAVQKFVPKVRFILLLLRAENRKLLTEAHMDGNVTTVAFDQFKLEMAGKSCMVHGSGPLLSNLCKSIAIDDDDEDDEDWEAEHKPQWKKDFERGCGLEVYEVELSPVYAQRDATFIEVVVDIIEQTGGLVYLVGLVESRSDSKKVLVNPGPTFKIKQAMPGMKIMGIFLASDREAIMQCDVGMVFLGRRERISMEEGDVDREDGAGDSVQKLKAKEDDVPEMNHVSLKAEHKAAALHLARVARRHQRSLKPLRPPLKRLAVGGHIIVLAVGTETNEDLRLGIEHFVKPLRQNVIADEVIPVVVVSAIQPRDWFNVETCDQVYFLQGSPTSLLDLQRANFTGASAIFITNAGAGSADAEKQESWTVDFEVICCTRLVESQLPVGSPTLVLSDIVVDSNHPFLPLPGLHGQPTKEVQFRAQGKESQGRWPWSKRQEAAIKRPKQKVEEYYVQPRFAAGRLFAGGTTFASLAANAFYNPTLIDLVSTMVTTHIRMVKLPHSWEGKSYFELFDFLLWKEKLLAIGIYRTAEVTTGGDDEEDGGRHSGRHGSKGLPLSPAGRHRSSGGEMTVRASRLSDSKATNKKTVKVSFVYTAPPGKETAMMPGDKVICFECGKD